jgi:hypothetical protein
MEATRGRDWPATSANSPRTRSPKNKNVTLPKLEWSELMLHKSSASLFDRGLIVPSLVIRRRRGYLHRTLSFIFRMLGGAVPFLFDIHHVENVVATGTCCNGGYARMSPTSAGVDSV